MAPSLSLLAVGLASVSAPALAQTAGTFADGGNTLVSAMMMFVGNQDKVYILDKAEGNAPQVAGHSAWGAVWDMNSHQSQVMDVKTNVFCASGMHLPNGSYVTFGGNGAVGRGGNIGSQVGPTGTGAWDSEYQDFDGGQSIRVLNPCSDSDDFTSSDCQWFDDPSVLAMQKRRWYSTAEPTGDGEIVLIGGFVNGGYINRNTPNTDPQFEGGAAECTYEFFPSNGRPATPMNFLVETSGLNAYAHSFLMPDGRMFVQANLSSVLWDFNANVETPLPAMPNGVVRVYPASGAVAMLPLTPANNYEPTILFCGGSDMPDAAWGNYSYPAINTWDYPASQDCQRITPEPQDGSAPVYVQDDNMLQGRSMGQFITLPDGKLFLVNGGLNGTAGYAQQTGETSSFNLMPFGESLASGPVLTPALYDPNAPAGKRWSNAGFAASTIPRLYHSSAILLPDASVLIAGSNPNVDVNTSTIFPTTYQAEIFYPPYFSSRTRPVPQGVPSTISYGGPSFDITIPSSSYSGSGNSAAASAQVVLIRGGFTTHAMNMGQRYMQLNNSYTVNSDGSIVLHTAQAPPNPNLFQPGPAFLFVNVNGIPSNGTMVIVGNGVMGTQPVSDIAALPANIQSNTANGSGQGGTAVGTKNGSSGDKTTTIALIAGAAGALVLIGAGAWFFLSRRRKPVAGASQSDKTGTYPMTGYNDGPNASAYESGYSGHARGAEGAGGLRSSDSSAFVPLQGDNYSQAWNASSASFNAPHAGVPYRDDVDGRGSAMGMSMDHDPYTRQPMQPHDMAQGYHQGYHQQQHGQGGAQQYRF
ncbi:glyoxal oxidase [Pluteus cervinus]|uniref:Glyoxal oxidase n=1 Tax=Pluteus cervinus TaxID=181527 RepID=A0ACD3AZW6_9AGAR|nr:glyoxal oxidase [Pluteus cervinus]